MSAPYNGVVWKPPHDHRQHHHSPSFFVFTEPNIAEAWRKDPQTTSLSDVVSSWQVFEVPNGGHTGHFLQPSRAELQAAFDTTDVKAVIQRILEEGEITLTGPRRHTSKLALDRGRGDAPRKNEAREKPISIAHGVGK
ncbi:hypothetical protein HKX48_005744 [Thoreauomyces humboldtii]|nr:hypothetical protein HKX48_005744 [Thoreauomyces humboldtii]